MSALDFVLALNSPAGLAAGSALMVAATIAPLLVAPLRQCGIGASGRGDCG